MKIEVLRSIGAADKRALGTDRGDLTEGSIVDCEKSLAEKLIKAGLAVTTEAVDKGEAKTPEIKAEKK